MFGVRRNHPVNGGSGLVLIAALALFSCTDHPTLTTNSPEALKAYNEGVHQFDNFYYGEAKASLERALQLDSNFALASARLALLYARMGSEADAQEEIARAMRHARVATLREQLYVRLLDHAIHFRNPEAAKVADSLLQLFPKDAEPYVWRGNFFELSKQFDAAFQLYQKAVRVDTGYAPAVMSLGYAYSARGEMDKAIEVMERYIRLAPEAADPRASFADILFRAGRYDEALEQYRRSLALKPDYWYAINRIGDVYVTLGRLNEADRQYDLGLTKMISNNQIRASHLALEATLQFKRGRYDETVRICEQSLALDSTNLRGAIIRILALTKLKKFHEAEEHIGIVKSEIIRKGLTESQLMLDFHLLRAQLYSEQKRFEEALAACDSAMEYGSELTRADVYQRLAEVKWMQGEYDAALDALEEALRFNPNSPNALLTLTKVYRATNDPQMTNEIGNRLLDLWKNADADFQPLLELKRLLSHPSIRSSRLS